MFRRNCLVTTFSWILVVTIGAASDRLRGEPSPPMLMRLNPIPGYQYCLPQAISGDGSTVVGYFPAEPSPQAFVWTAEKGMVSLGWLPGTLRSGANDVSQNGSVVVGISGNIDPSEFYGFRWTLKDGMQALPGLPGATITNATAVSADGQTIAGNSSTDTNFTMGCRWKNLTMPVAIGSLSPNPPTTSQARGISANGNVIVGMTDPFNSERAIRWTAGTGMQALSGGGGYWAQAASANGSVIVGYGTFGGIRWTAATGAVTISLDLPYSVSADGSVIVGREDLPPNWNAQVWTSQCGGRSIANMLKDAGVPGVGAWQLVHAYDIADDNRTIVGVGIAPGSKSPGFGLWDGFIARLPRKGDLDFDGDVDTQDLLKIISSWGPCAPGTCTLRDVNCDGFVNTSDLIAVIENWDS